MSASSNGVKPGFFGRLKGLFRRSDEESDADNGQASVGASSPLSPPAVEVASGHGAAASSPAPRNQSANKSTSGIAGVAIPLQAILNGLPLELRPKVRVQTVGDLTVNITVDKILSQLGQGVVQIPFGDIRQAAPQVFAPGIESDRIPVPLPLNEILARINPALLVRRSARKQVEVPTDITSPFDGAAGGQGLSVSVGNAKPVQPAAPRRAAPTPPVPGRGSISSVNIPPPPSSAAAAAASIPFSFTKAPTAAPAAGPTPFPTITPITPITQAPTPAPAPAPAPTSTVHMTRPQPPVPMPAPVARAVPVSTSAADHAVLAIALNAISDDWAEGIREEIAQQNLTDARVALPVETVETALKRGRVTFTWKALRACIRPATPPTVSPHDATEVDLPLKVIAPLFIARKQSAAQPQQKLVVDEEIPNLFFGFPQAEPSPAAPETPLAAPTFTPTFAPATGFLAVNPVAAAAPAPAAPPAAMAAMPAAAMPAAPAPAGKPDTNYYVWDDASDTKQLHIEALRRGGATSTEFVKRYASPNEIVSRAVALESVAGALIALPDGLMVASRIPPELNADTLAAFLPQLFNKVSQCTKELRMGELNNLNFTVGNVPWKIFRVNAIFFAVFGRPAQPLPTGQLSALAAELDRKNK